MRRRVCASYRGLSSSMHTELDYRRLC